MAFKKRLKSQIIDNTQVNVTSEYGRKSVNKGIKKSCSVVINGLLMASMVLSMGATSMEVKADEIDKGVNEVELQSDGIPYSIEDELDALTSADGGVIGEVINAEMDAITTIGETVVEDVITEEMDAITTAGGVVVEEDIAVASEFSDEESLVEFRSMQTSRANVKEVKLAGTDRYKTAVEISKAGWSTANKALLVNGTALPDALCASPLADEYNAPILLTEKNSINADTLKELKRLGVKEVTLIGSEGVISKAQSDQLVKEGFKVERVGGVDRYDTSLKIANKLKGLYQAKGSQGRKTVFIANGVKGLADATSVSSPAGIKDAVILYTNGTDLKGIKDYITSSSDDVYLVGGPSVVSDGIEKELKTTTNKNIKRISGTDRKDTNAKVITEFFPSEKVDTMYLAKDGMGDDNQLVDGLAVGALASKTKNPVMLASDNLGSSQEAVLKSRSVNTVAQVGDGRNANPTKQAVGIINAIAQPEAEDGMKLPTINFAKEKSLKMSGNGGYNRPSWNTIQGEITVKYGNPNTRPHSYGSKNQTEYNKVVDHVKNTLKSINFRLEMHWVYTQYHLNGGRDANYVDPVFKKNNINITYKDWSVNNKYVIAGLQKGIVSRADAENLAIYKSAVSHLWSKTADATDPKTGHPYSAHQKIFEGISDCDSSAQFDLIIADVLGFNGIVGGDVGHQDIMLQVGNYWWVDASTPTLNKSDNVFQKIPVLYEAPTY